MFSRSQIHYPMTTLTQRRNHVFASNLLLTGLVVIYLILIVRWVIGVAPLQPMRWPYLLHVATIISFLMMAMPYYSVRSGKLWTRLLVLAVIFGTLLLNLAHLQEIKTDPLNMLSWAVYLITHIWGLTLLFRRPQLQRID